MKKIKINLGCGITVRGNGFINVDKYYTEKQLKEKKGAFIAAVFEKGAKYIQADMMKLPFPDNYADYIETVDAVEHISFRGIEKVFQEMYRVLKPGGKLCICTTNFDALAKTWVDYIVGKPLDNKQAFDNFLNVMETIYGNQWQEGEFHLMPFNPQFMAILLNQVGFKPEKTKIIIYPMGNSELKNKIKTQKWEKGAVNRTENIWAEAIK